MQVDLDSFIDGTQSFRLREALWLSQWKVYAFPTPDQLKQIVKIAPTLQFIRNRYGKPVVIHSWLRPVEYNRQIKGAPDSWHTRGGAVDFHIVTMNCDELRADMKNHLAHWNIRMERLDGSNWVHIDNRPVPSGGERYFFVQGSLG